MAREHVDNLALALVPPLRPEHCDVQRHSGIWYRERRSFLAGHVFMILLDGTSLTLPDLVAISYDFVPVGLSDAARTGVRAARAVVDEFAHHDTPTYGINT